ncbi:hypothetical protein Salmuc_04836 [Salipiger mucosus DSM 16094]|uniref:Uncharacterized protein n=1 Tax=Salipiger mucosus DSM 16094 TaxID=1123237 RepID=S9S5W5_9RHOB|nr:hypothetical protein Salmuc_04836 [Salipiger mucosus DSM 16094]
MPVRFRDLHIFFSPCGRLVAASIPCHKAMEAVDSPPTAIFGTREQCLTR